MLGQPVERRDAEVRAQGLRAAPVIDDRQNGEARIRQQETCDTCTRRGSGEDQVVNDHQQRQDQAELLREDPGDVSRPRKRQPGHPIRGPEPYEPVEAGEAAERPQEIDSVR